MGEDKICDPRFELLRNFRPQTVIALCAVLKIKMEELANAINDTRLGVSKALNGMQEDGLLELHRGEIVIPDIERLVP